MCRHSSSELEALGVRVEAGIDVSDANAVRELATRVQDVTLDLLIKNNAGILRGESLDQLDSESIERQFEVNALAALLRVSAALLPRIAKGGNRHRHQPHGFDRRQFFRRLLRLSHVEGGGERGRRVAGSRRLAGPGIAVALIHGRSPPT